MRIILRRDEHEEEQFRLATAALLDGGSEEDREVRRSAVNQLINVAVAEKVSALRTAEYFAERAAKADIRKAMRVLKRAGRKNPPVPGDELPDTRPRRRR
jgi:hypothetical protein